MQNSSSSLHSGFEISIRKLNLFLTTENNEIWIDKRRVDLKAVRANIEILKI